MIREVPEGPASTWKDSAAKEWIRPEAIEYREYQTRIMETVRHKSTLVVLPTALGKTVIALLLAIERVEKGKVFFLSPTRPLVQQHYQTFDEKTFMEEGELVLITGKSPPQNRLALYKMARIVFATPQCVHNDLRKGLLRLDDASLIIFDEAHRARGNYAYVTIATYYSRQHSHPLVLALTASPGSHEEKIAEVCRNLRIDSIEYRTDEDEDVKPYIQPIELQWKRIQLPEAHSQVRDKLREMLSHRIRALQSFGLLLGRQPTSVGRHDLLKLNRELQEKIRNREGGHIYHVKIEATAVLSIMHMIELIETQGPETLKAFINKSLFKKALQGSRGHKSILGDPLFNEAKWILKQCLNVENPKTIELLRVLRDQIETKSTSRLIVFTQYRDTINTLLRELEKHTEIKAERFVGQGEREDDPGMTQHQQHEALTKLRNGEANVLVATSIAEEGLDIPEVDHVVFYEPVASEIRYIQRRGRTGRRVSGKVTILIAEKTLDEAYYWASMKRTKKMKKTIMQLNQKLPKILEETQRQSHRQSVLTTSQPQTRLANSKRRTTVEAELKKSIRSELWKPISFQTKGLSRAMTWLACHLPENLMSIEDIVKQAITETRVEKPTIETAIWRLIQQGQLYQPEPGKVRKL